MRIVIKYYSVKHHYYKIIKAFLLERRDHVTCSNKLKEQTSSLLNNNKLLIISFIHQKP